MSEERLKEIRSKINYLAGLDYDVKDEVELYNEVIRLREENKMLDNLRNANYLSWQDSLSRIEKAVEYIEEMQVWCIEFDNYGVITDGLLNILNGRSDE